MMVRELLGWHLELGGELIVGALAQCGDGLPGERVVDLVWRPHADQA